MASFDGAVPPGGMGNIRILLRTEGYSGEIKKTAKVYTDDPEREQIFLSVTARVMPAIILSRRYLHFEGTAGQKILKDVEITTQLEKPLVLEPDLFNLDGKMTYRLEEIEKGRKFRVLFETIPGPEMNYRGFLRLRTNYSEKPELTIWIWGHITGKV